MRAESFRETCVSLIARRMLFASPEAPSSPARHSGSRLVKFNLRDERQGRQHTSPCSWAAFPQASQVPVALLSLRLRRQRSCLAYFSPGRCGDGLSAI